MKTVHCVRAFATFAFLCSVIPAQDLLGVTWNGTVVRINSYTGAASPIGPGLMGQNSLARSSNGTFWSSRRLGATLWDLTRIDPTTGIATPMFACPDLRGLSTGPGTSLYGIKRLGPTTALVQIDTNNGFATTIGNTGFDGIQGLAAHQGVLYAWDVAAGLLTVNPTTGVATDPFPAVGGPIFLQSLCSHPDGRLLVGGGDSAGFDSIYSVDVSTGTTSPIAAITGAQDVRGFEPLAGSTAEFGLGCAGTFGTVVHTVTGTNQVGGTLVTSSNNHAANSIGLVVFGSAIPSVSLDSLFGTNGCSLHVNLDGWLAVLTDATAPATLQFAFTVSPAMSGTRINLQHACFEPVPGGLSTSNAVAVQFP